jgi:hypothetical protein
LRSTGKAKKRSSRNSRRRWAVYFKHSSVAMLTSP